MGHAARSAGLALVDRGGIFGSAADESHRFVDSHLAEQLVDARIAGNDRDGGLGESACSTNG